MQFCVQMTVRIPHDENPEKVKKLTAQEHERAEELIKQGKWLNAWRVVGKWANLSIFEMENNVELHEILNSLPLFPYMQVEVIALCSMPGFQKGQQ